MGLEWPLPFYYYSIDQPLEYSQVDSKSLFIENMEKSSSLSSFLAEEMMDNLSSGEQFDFRIMDLLCNNTVIICKF